MNRVQLTLRVIADAYGVSLKDMISRKQTEPLPVCRQIFCKLMYKAYENAEVMEALNISKSTLLQNVVTATNKINDIPQFAADYNAIREDVIKLKRIGMAETKREKKAAVLSVTKRRNYIMMVIDKACKVCEVSVDDVLGDRRKKELVYTRKLIAYILHEKYKPYEIAFELKVDRSSVYHYVDSMSDLLDTYEEDRKKYHTTINDIEYETEFKTKRTGRAALAAH